MASKRKSSTPCMIPSKVVRPSEEVVLDSDLLLRPARSSGGSGGGLSPVNADSSRAERADALRDGGGIYTCKPCHFETPDLNLFLDHVYSGHPDFRADPGFLCVGCGVSAPKFEGLALHNARVHPSTLTTSLQLRRRKDRRGAVVVEQHLLVAPESSGDDGEIHITKTPIMKMLRGKPEVKRGIIVSHLGGTDENSSDSTPPSKETEKKEVSHVPTMVSSGTTVVSSGTTKTHGLPSAIQIVNGSGALPLLKTPITQVVSVVQNRNLLSAPVTASSNSSSTSSPSSKNLPKVMIPLSSIPTYSASMDSSSFLKSSFSKFPYPTKAELCYLTVVTKFPEEQIKIWFTAQRLKQGISWSPEEIEEARRKMFNTIIQTASSSSSATGHGPSQRVPATQTIAVLPTGIPHLLQGSLVGQGGVIVTQPVVANGIHVSSAPVALAVTPKPQAAARPMMQARPAAALVADKGVGMVVGTVGSSSSSSSSQSGGGAPSSVITSSHGSVINLSLASNASAKQAGANHANANRASPNQGSANHASANQASIIQAGANSASTNQGSAKVSTVNGRVGGSTKVELKDKNKSDVSAKSSVASDITGNQVSCSGSVVVPQGHERAAARATSTTDHKPSQSRAKEEEEEPEEKKKSNTSSAGIGGGSTSSAPSGAEEAELEAGESPSSPSSKSSSSSPSPAVCTPLGSLLESSLGKSKKSQGQLSALKDSFQSNQFPDQEEVERLIALTGLTIREVRKWFSDRRYHHRNLKGPRGGGASGGGSTRGAGVGGANSLDSAPVSPTASLTPTSPGTPSRRGARVPSPDFTAIRYKEREPHQVKALEASFAQEAEPSAEEVDRLRLDTKMTRREIHSWFAERRKRVAAEKKREEAEQAMQKEEEEEEQGEEQGEGEEERQREDGAPKVNPIKINLKMLKVTEAKAEGEAAAQPVAPPPSSTPPTSARPPPAASRPPTSRAPVVRGKKTAEQLELLKRVYARTQWPSAAQYDQLISGTGLPRPDVVRWFGDSRYTQKNSQLKWLEAYQDAALEEELQRANQEVLQEHLRTHGRLEEAQLQSLAAASGLTSDLVRHWFSRQASLLPHLEAKPLTPGAAPGAAAAAAPGAAAGAAAAAAPGAAPGAAAGGSGSSPPAPQPGGGSEEKMEQSVCGLGTEGGAAETAVSKPAEGSG